MKSPRGGDKFLHRPFQAYDDAGGRVRPLCFFYWIFFRRLVMLTFSSLG